MSIADSLLETGVYLVKEGRCLIRIDNHYEVALRSKPNYPIYEGDDEEAAINILLNGYNKTA